MTPRYSFWSKASLATSTALMLAAGLAATPAAAQQPGTLDASFGTNGRVLGNFLSAAGSDAAKSVLVQPDGKIVVAGQSNAGAELCRLNPDGSLDASFGTGGKASYAFGGGSYAGNTGTGPSRPWAVHRLPSGQYYLVGRTSPAGFLARVQPNGSLDASFGTAGVVKMMPGSHGMTVYGLAVQSTGKMALFCTVAQLSGYGGHVRLYNADGSPDAVFAGGAGTYIHYTNYPGLSFSGCTAGTVLANDKVLAAGYEFNGSVSVAGVCQLTADGQRDTSFGSSGFATLPNTVAGVSINTTCYALAVQSDGRILLAGTYSVAGSGLTQGLVARFNADGTPDNGFGTNGLSTVAFPGRAKQLLTSLAVQPDGKIVATGFTQTLNADFNNPAASFALVRLNANGTPDAGFGTAGRVELTENTQNIFQSVALQPDGRIVAAGYTASGGGSTSRDLSDITIGPNYPNVNDNYDGMPQNSQFGLYRFTAGVTTAATTPRPGARLALYPNPAVERVMVEATGLPTGPAELRLLNALGQLARQEAAPAPGGTLRHALPLTGLAPGVYTLQLRTAGTTATQRLLVR